MTLLTRRSVLTGLLAAPIVCRQGLLMRVRPIQTAMRPLGFNMVPTPEIVAYNVMGLEFVNSTGRHQVGDVVGFADNQPKLGIVRCVIPGEGYYLTTHTELSRMALLLPPLDAAAPLC